MDDELARAMAEFQRCIEDRDLSAAERVLDDDYALVLVAPARAVMPRHRWLEVLEDYVIHEYVVEEQVVDQDGDGAAVAHRVRMKATVLGVDRSGIFVISDVWRRSPGGWRIWRRHSTPLSAGTLPGVN
ncbi:MAG: nuclear transport factor 2 family protein [Actinobacteria bacterium]|nr:nuclear transport factor 2 family protein [Actinomycetota bacterium]MBW3650387.1 nuclear transport factor 2 family protein [Actinomycetota bacterium]